MKLKLLSDLHIEGFANKKIYENPTQAEVLVLAGDINVGADRVWPDLERFAENFQDVVYVPGNHEWYKNSFEEFHAKLTEFSGGTNIHYLCNSSVKIKDVTFLGTPLWTNFRGNGRYAGEMRGLISDFQWYSPYVCMERGVQAQAWLKQAYEATEGKKVVVTHWLPALECIDPWYAQEVTLNRYFANDMGDWIKGLTNVPYWFHGHTHATVDAVLGETRVIANPAGYRNRAGYYENSKFKEDAIYEV